MIITKCRFCGKPIAMLKAPKNRLVPVEMDILKSDDTEFNPKIHVNHKKVCSEFKKVKK